MTSGKQAYQESSNTNVISSLQVNFKLFLIVVCTRMTTEAWVRE